MKKSLVSVALSLLALQAPLLAAEHSTGLSPREIATLAQLEMSVLVPAWVPKGFQISQVQAEKASDRAPEHYRISFKGPQQQNFQISGARQLSATAPGGIRHAVRHADFGLLWLWQYGPYNPAASSFYTGCAIRVGEVCYDFSSVGGQGLRRISAQDASLILGSLTQL